MACAAKCTCPSIKLGELRDQARLLQLLFGFLSLPKANSLPIALGLKQESVTLLEISKLHPHELCLLVCYRRCFIWESVVRHAALVYWPEFRSVRYSGAENVLSMGIAVGTSTVVHYTEEVCYWEGPLSEVPL